MPRPPHQVVVISWDGFRPDFYLSNQFQTPRLRALKKQGASALGVVPVYPSVTYPNHATMLTGVTPARHGVYSNTVFSWDNGPERDWYWATSFLRSPSLWSVSQKAGLATASLGWPVSLGAPVTYNIPEIFIPSGTNGPDVWELTRRNSTRALIDEINHPEGFATDFEHDRWMTAAALAILERHQPALLFLHLTNVDHTQHESGRNSKQTLQAVSEADALVGRIAAVLDPNHSTLIVLGDHGFRDYTRELRINALLAERGLLTVQDGKITDWKAVALVAGGSAAIYVRDKSQSARVMELLRKEAPGRFQIVKRPQLDLLGAFPEAICAIEPLDGFSSSSLLAGPWVGNPGPVHGNHGYLPMNKAMHAGLIAWGAEVSKGRSLGRVQMIDIAPTVAGLLGLELPSAQGHALKLR